MERIKVHSLRPLQSSQRHDRAHDKDWKERKLRLRDVIISNVLKLRQDKLKLNVKIQTDL